MNSRFESILGNSLFRAFGKNVVIPNVIFLDMTTNWQENTTGVSRIKQALATRYDFNVNPYFYAYSLFLSEAIWPGGVRF